MEFKEDRGALDRYWETKVYAVLPTFRRDVFQNFENVLKQGGLSFGNVDKMTSYHINIQQHLSVFRSIHAGFVIEPYPAWSAIEVSGLIEQDRFVELRVIARC